MATLLSHGVVAAAMGAVYARQEPMPASFWAVAIMASILPDLDVIGFYYAVPYSAPLGHRGFSHSLAAALVVGGMAGWIVSRHPAVRKSLGSLAAFFFLVAASHGVLDALTNGGLGVAFFWPFLNTRYFFPWRPIPVSPIGAAVFSARGLNVLTKEAIWLWIPATAAALLATLLSF